MVAVYDSALSHLDGLLERFGAALEITPTQYTLAVERYEAVGRWLAAPDSPLAPYDPRIYPQGSLATGTTVKPILRNEYDIDLVIEYLATTSMFPSPLVLLYLTEARLREHGTYAKMLVRLNRCVRVDYANEFHLDVLPAVPCPDDGPDCLLVPDRKAEAWKPSAPRAYAAWFLDQAHRGYAPSVKMSVEPVPAQSEVKSALQRVVQLLKRWRDVRWADECENAPISIVLSTLAAEAYGGETSIAAAMTAVLDRIVARIAAVPAGERLRVENPTNRKEDLSEKWDTKPEAYASFVGGMLELHEDWSALVAARGPAVAGRLGALFGEELAVKIVRESAREVAGASSSGRLAVTPLSSGCLTSAGTAGSVAVRPHTFYGEE